LRLRICRFEKAAAHVVIELAVAATMGVGVPEIAAA
jgi:hypothetical protein